MMTSRMITLKLCTVLPLLFAVGEVHAGDVVKIGTTAPAASPWGQVLKVWAEAVKKRSGEALELQFFYNGQQGDDAAMVAKMKAGQLDAAAIGAVGLAKIYKPILALQIPGLFTTWAKLDAARDAMKGEFGKGINDAGFTIIGWGDLGMTHVMSKEIPINVPDDIKGKQKPWVWRDDVILPGLFQTIGGVTPVSLSLPEVLPNLNTGAINIVITQSLSAEQLQWASKLDTIVADNFGVAVGAVVISSKRLAALSQEHRNIIAETGLVAANALTKRIRSEDDAAFARLKGKMTVINLSPDNRAKWDAIFKQLRQRLGQGTFSPDLIARLEQLAK